MKPQKATRFLEEAIASQQAGNLRQASKFYRRYLKSVPGDANVMHTLGSLYYQLEDLESAGKYLEMAHEQEPQNPDYLNDLGAFLLSTGNYSSAVKYLRLVTERLPDLAQGFYNLGLALHGLGNSAEAITALEKAVCLQPDYVAAMHNLAVIYFELGRYVQAEEICRKTLRLAPGLHHAHFYLGQILSRQHRYDAAVDAFQKACDLNHDCPEYIVALARSLHEAGKTEDGIQLLRESMHQLPDEVSISVLLGELLQIVGQFEESEKLYQEILFHQQDISTALFNYAHVRKFTSKDKDYIQRIEESIADRNLSESSRIIAGFALGKIHDDCHEYDKAFINYQEANKLKHKQVKYDREITERNIDKIISVFTKDFFSDFSAMGTDQHLPVFIVGMPRSGTTLTEQIISAHPEAAGAGELSYFYSLGLQMPGLLQTEKAWPECCLVLNKTATDQIVHHYIELLRRYSASAKRITDKMPMNFYYLGLIRVLFPVAPIIHCQRDPLDICLSIYFQNFSKMHGYACDLLDIGHMYLQYERLMAHWRRVLPRPMLEVKYEDIIADQERTSRDLVAFCGLEWDENCLNFQAGQRLVRTASNWQVRQPLYTSSIGRWKNYEKHLGPLLKLFGESGAKI